MINHLTKFNTHSEYQQNKDNLIKPHVSYCLDVKDVHYNPYVNPTNAVLIATYQYIEDTDMLLYLCGTGYGLWGVHMFSKIEINDSEVSIQDLDENNGYLNSLNDTDTVKYTLLNPTTTGYIDFDGSTFSDYGAIFSQSNIYNVIIPDGVVNIGPSTFDSCIALTSVTLPNSVINIGDNAFFGCESLNSINIPNSVENIGEGSFSYCSSLSSITIPSSVTSIGGSAFSGCSSLTSVTINNGVTTIGQDAFYGCSDLASIEIPSSVTSIGGSAFVYCSSLTSVILLSTTPPTLEMNVFDNNASGRKIYVPSESVNAYKTATNWSAYANDILPIQ